MCSVQGLDESEAKKVDFYTRQYIDALSPSNFALTNPEVLQETMRSGGKIYSKDSITYWMTLPRAMARNCA